MNEPARKVTHPQGLLNEAIAELENSRSQLIRVREFASYAHLTADHVPGGIIMGWGSLFAIISDLTEQVSDQLDEVDLKLEAALSQQRATAGGLR
ncbi:MAG: hypothetical protein P1P84_22130 [Deferrisomatales bacterium]|nr:hypothetical protein [Deferrisomatales bacterium]